MNRYERKLRRRHQRRTAKPVSPWTVIGWLLLICLSAVVAGVAVFFMLMILGGLVMVA